MTDFLSALKGTKTTIITKKADQTVNNSTTLVDDDDLTLTLKANTRYFVRFYARVISPSAADFDWTFKAVSGVSYEDKRATTGQGQMISFGSESTLATNGTDQDVGYGVGFLKTGSGGGELIVQWAQNVATVGDTKLLEGSVLIVFEE